MMSENDGFCGECGDKYGNKCSVVVQCQVHKKKCFQCRPCQKVVKQLRTCNCGRQCQNDQLYQDFTCGKLLCRFQFLNIDLHSQIIKLSCGCSYGNNQILEHIIGFISNFCYTCGRNIYKPSHNEINLCKLCSVSNVEIKQTISPKPKQYKQPQKNVQLNKQISERERQVNSQNIILSILKDELANLEQSIQISQYSTFQIKQKMDEDNQIQKECSICTLQYNNSDRKPFMVCLHQHIFCEQCVNQVRAPLVTCPLCKDTILPDQIQPSHQTLRLIDIRNRIKQTFSSKNRLLSFYEQNLEQVGEQIISFKPIEQDIQTTESYLSLQAQKKKYIQQQKVNKRQSEQKNEVLGKKRNRVVSQSKKGSKKRKQVKQQNE